MRADVLSRALACVIVVAILAQAEPVPVRHTQGLLHGFLVLRDLDNKTLALGDLLQTATGSRVNAELTFRFNDGSMHQETAVFSQRRTFQLITYHLIQKGPAFKQDVDFSLNVAKGQAIVHYKNDHDKQGTITEHLKMPADLANGFLTTLILDVDPKAPKTTVSLAVATPKPRIVKLNITPSEESTFLVAGVPQKAISYDIKVDLGGITGLVAPLIGKQPPDIHMWLMSGKAPGFLKIEGALFEGGPIWRAELVSPSWPVPH